MLNRLLIVFGGALFVLLSELSVAGSQLYFIHNDHLGTPQVVTDKDQNVVWSTDKTPFGQLENESGSIEQPIRFPGQYADPETGYYYNYYRDYDPSLGRYIQSDPIGLGDGPNTYTYVYNNPLSYTDPYGLSGFFGGLPNLVRPWVRLPNGGGRIATPKKGESAAQLAKRQSALDRYQQMKNQEYIDKPLIPPSQKLDNVGNILKLGKNVAKAIENMNFGLGVPLLFSPEGECAPLPPPPPQWAPGTCLAEGTCT